MPEFQPGDVVKLKSGAPAMTVERRELWNGEQRVFCEWFAHN